MTHVLVVCARRYNPLELFPALTIMKSRGHTYEVVSTDTIIQDEPTMTPSKIKRTIDDVKDVSEFGALMIVSGNSYDTESYWHDKRVLEYVKIFQVKTLPIAAICAAVPIIRFAAKGRKVSFFPLIRSREILVGAGAILQNVSMTRDHNLVTAEHEMATEIWAEEFCNLMEGLPAEPPLVDSGFRPLGRPRRPIPEVVRLQKSVKRS